MSWMVYADAQNGLPCECVVLELSIFFWLAGASAFPCPQRWVATSLLRKALIRTA